MNIEHKTAAPTAPKRAPENKAIVVPFELKGVDRQNRTFTGLAAAFSQDLGGDVIRPGAFKRTLRDWKATKGKRIIYLIDSHSYGSIRNVVGKMTDADETDDGLMTTQQVLDTPDGEEAFKRVEGGYINGMSIGYQAIKIQRPTDEQMRTGIFRFLDEVKLLENSLVIWPMNEDARIKQARTLLSLATERQLTESELVELKSLQDELGVLPEPVAPAPKGLAPEDPRRLAMSEAVRALTLRGLGG